MKSVVLLSIIAFAVCISACKKKKQEEPVAANNIAGNWDATGYVCLGAPAIEKLNIVQTGDDIVATKTFGDECVKTGSVTFKGSYDKAKSAFVVTLMLGSPGLPSTDQSPNQTVTIIDKDNLTTSFGVTLKRSK